MNKIWCEEYRPKKIEDMILPDDMKESFEQYIQQKAPTNLLFCGGPGIGKTSVAKIISKTSEVDVLWLNASDERGIDVARGVIKSFISTKSFAKRKLVILDEGESGTNEFFMALKGIIEQYHKNASFVLTTNFLFKIPEAIQSRFQIYNFRKPEKQQILDYYKRVLTNEQISYQDEQLEKVYKLCNGDLRRSLHYMQKNSMSGTLKLEANEYVEIIKMIGEKNTQGIKTYFAQNEIDYAGLYRYMYDLTPIRIKLILIAKYMDMHTRTIDPEINMMGLISELIELK